MKAKIIYILVLFVAILTVTSCQDQDDTVTPNSLQIKDFVWKGLNLYYLWQAEVPNLSNNKFENQAQLNGFLNQYDTAEALFQSLLYKPSSQFSSTEAIDRFSWIVSDYIKLEGQLQGSTTQNGVQFGLSYKSSGSKELIGWVRYIVPNSDAANKEIKRGDVFYAVNGTLLTIDNYQSLLFSSSTQYTLEMADINGGAFTPNGRRVSLTKTALVENPILINKVIKWGSHTIGYMMYNGFYSNYDTQLNAAFGELKSAGVTDFVLDLRYNGGGSIQTATRLASMITGAYTGQTFAKQQWNAKIESYYNANDPSSLKNLFTDKIGNTPINSINMSKVYILTSARSASASELVINGLKPFITVVQIGDTTVGKNVGSVTLYDSPTFGKTDRNPNHRYAMQPLVLKIVNAAGFGDYQTGLVPTFQLKETLSSLGVLGSATEPLLGLAIGKITGTAKYQQIKNQTVYPYFTDSNAMNDFKNLMYLDQAPEGLLKALE